MRFERGRSVEPALDCGSTADWEFTLEVQNGRVEAFHPCFTSSPLDEFRREWIVSSS